MFNYQLISLHQIDNTEFEVNNTLYHYIIANEFNQINGYRSGSQVDVEQHINVILQRLNQRLADSHGSFIKQVYRADDLSSIL